MASFSVLTIDQFLRATALDALLDEIEDSTRAHAVAAASQVSNAYIIVPYLYLIQDFRI